jgi:nimB protein
MMARTMRRFKQQLPAEEVERILRNGRYCIMAVSGDDDYPYAVPLNYVYDGTSIYIHSAAQGHKIDALKRNPKCSLCIVDKDDVIPEEFTSYFRSVIAFGTAHFVESTDEKIAALRLLGDKYSPGIDSEAEIARFIRSVCIVRIDIDSVTGKEAIELTKARTHDKSYS